MTSPARAVGSTTRSDGPATAGHPSARAASRSEPGTMAMTSWEARVTTGSIMTARASAAANPDFRLSCCGTTQSR